MPIHRELQLARQKSLLRCVPLVHAGMWISLVLKKSTYSGFYCPQVELDVCLWNQFVFPKYRRTHSSSLDFAVRVFGLLYCFLHAAI